ncbi:hypothetical protein ASG89_16885 [Paenibacillus sp. Soil766]|uniref:LamG domain-containing protein n=1 Tax=Paenibacillus sp. Soil766 TaxID=1736404 RepID=UPI00070FF54C|nr:LamG-like jellyroll fold domain-containing protein [Paenibacillus sp. Soil766]KRF08104.1 hypothetical protein ASG89_16885 [Paenibacillus sp. Soil766]
MKQTRTKLARLILGAVLLVSSGYALLGYEEHASASTPAIVISPQETVITNSPTEVVMQAPIGSMIEIFEGQEMLMAKSVAGYSVIKIALPQLSYGVHMLTAKVQLGNEGYDFALPPIVVHQSEVFTIEDVSTIAFALPEHQDWDMNGDNEFVPKDEIGYLLSKIEPIAAVNPIYDLSVVQTATTATYATLTFSQPVGAESVSLLRKSGSDDAFITVASLSVNEATYIVNGLTPSTSYQFKLKVVGGMNAGESNIVSVATAAAPVIPPVQPVAEPYQALHFDGSGDYVEIPHNTAYNSSSFTIEAWVKPEAYIWKAAFVSKYQEQNQSSFTLRLNDGLYDKINFQVSDGNELDSSAVLNLNTWYHIAALYEDTTRTIKLYINGVLNKVQPNVAYQKNTSPITIGVDFLDTANSNHAARYFKGQIGEVRFWTVARTETQIQTDMYNHAGTQNHSDLAGYWTFNVGANDESGNGRHGTIRGNPATIK